MGQDLEALKGTLQIHKALQGLRDSGLEGKKENITFIDEGSLVCLIYPSDKSIMHLAQNTLLLGTSLMAAYLAVHEHTCTPLLNYPPPLFSPKLRTKGLLRNST